MGEIEINPMGWKELITNPIEELKTTLGDISKQQERIIEMILSIDGDAIRYITNPTEEQITTALKQNGFAIRHILPVNITDDIARIAIEQNKRAIAFVPKPTIPMWLIAIQDEAPADPDHPIHLLKNAEMGRIQKTLLYTNFLDAAPSNIWDIRDDIRGYCDEASIWEFLFTHHPEVNNLVHYCPDDILTKIIDDVMVINPKILSDCPAWIWTEERAKRLLDNDLTSLRRAYAMTRDFMTPVELFRYAMDISKTESDIDYVLYMFPENLRMIDNLAVLLDSKNGLKALKHLFNLWNGNRELVEYVLNRFTFEDICDNVNLDIIENNMLTHLPAVKRLKYKLKLKKYRKQPKLITIPMEELTHKPTIHGVSLNGDDKDE